MHIQITEEQLLKEGRKNTDEICMVTIDVLSVWSIISIDLFEESEGKLLQRILSLNGLHYNERSLTQREVHGGVQENSER